jgi:hypothetical protein
MLRMPSNYCQAWKALVGQTLLSVQRNLASAYADRQECLSYKTLLRKLCGYQAMNVREAIKETH